jgi:Uma2 family endonuclease
VSSNPVTKLTEDQYLAIERAAEFRSEFVNGEMFAMSGGTMRHSALQANILVELSPLIRGRGCRAFAADMRVRVSATGMYTYPDVSVLCGRPQLADEHADTLLNPIVIFEVLSPSSEKYDRGLKFQSYRTIESFQDYILVDQDRVRIEHYTRQGSNTWNLRDCQGLDEDLVVVSLGVTLSLRRIYDGVDPPAA